MSDSREVDKFRFADDPEVVAYATLLYQVIRFAGGSSNCRNALCTDSLLVAHKTWTSRIEEPQSAVIFRRSFEVSTCSTSAVNQVLCARGSARPMEELTDSRERVTHSSASQSRSWQTGRDS